MKNEKMCREILMGMNFLNIPSINFLNLKNKYGGIEGLYNYISDCMVGLDKVDY